MQRLAFVTPPGNRFFISILVKALAPHFEIREFIATEAEVVRQALAWGDIVWFEFCQPPFLAIIDKLGGYPKRVVVRLHRYEAVDRDFVTKVAWENVDCLILTSGSMVGIVKHRVPGIEQRTRIALDYLSADLERFVWSPDKNPHLIAWAGNLIARKNPALALLIMDGVRRRDPRYHLHVAGAGKDFLVMMDCDRLLDRLDLRGHVTFHGSVQDMPAFYAGKGTFLSTSMHESVGAAITEAVASGCSPVIYDFHGAEEFWPADRLFSTVERAVELVLNPTGRDYRDTIVGRLSTADQVRRLVPLLSGLPKNPLSRPP